MVEFGATSAVAATYIATLPGNQAVSTTNSAAGGSADALATSSYLGGAGANAEVSYHVDLIGPAGVYVPIRFLAAGFVEGMILATGSPYGTGLHADATYVVNFSNATRYQISGNAVIGPGLYASFAVDEVVRVLAGSFFDVYLSANAGAGGPGSNPAFAHAFVDPVFTIDPAFASLYRLEGIPGAAVGEPVPPTLPPPSSTVPEPGTWTIVLLGSSLLACARRRRPSERCSQRTQERRVWAPPATA